MLLNSLNSPNLEVRNTSEKSEKFRAKSRKLDDDAILCNRRRLIPKTFLAFSRTILLNVGIDPNFPQKKVWFFLALFKGQKKLVSNA